MCDVFGQKHEFKICYNLFIQTNKCVLLTHWKLAMGSLGRVERDVSSKISFSLDYNLNVYDYKLHVTFGIHMGS